MYQCRTKMKAFRQKISAWINTHPARAALIVALLALVRLLGIGNLFSSTKDAYESMTTDLIVGLFLPDIFTLFLSGVAIMFGWKAMKYHGGFLKKGKGGFLIGILCAVLSFTSVGDALPIATHFLFTVGGKTAWYALTDPDRAKDALQEYFNEMEIASSGGVIENEAEEGEYILEAYVEQIPTGAADDTKVCVTGTLTNTTSKDWTGIELEFLILDSENKPAMVADMMPTLRVDIQGLSAGGTVEFKSNEFPDIVLPDTLTKYQIIGFTYGTMVEEDE